MPNFYWEKLIVGTILINSFPKTIILFFILFLLLINKFITYSNKKMIYMLAMYIFKKCLFKHIALTGSSNKKLFSTDKFTLKKKNIELGGHISFYSRPIESF